MFESGVRTTSQSRRLRARDRYTATLLFGLSLLFAAAGLPAAALGDPDASDPIVGTTNVNPDAPVRLSETPARLDDHPGKALHGSLARLRDAYSPDGADTAAARGVPPELIDAGRVLVEVRTAPGSSARNALNAVAAEVRHRFTSSMYEAWLPIERLDELARRPEVVRVWPARTVQLKEGSVTSQGVAAGRADHWQAGGLDGTGITIAIIDSFDNTSGEVNDLQSSGDWPPDSRLSTVKVDTTGSGGSFGGNGINHGNAVLEIAYDIAPGANFIAYDTRFLSDWREAIDQAVNAGADVISASLGAPLDGIGDGSALAGSVAEKVEAAEAAGVFYINSAGNSREQHWGGPYDTGSFGTNADLHAWDGGGQKVNPYGPGDGSAYCIGDGTGLRGELFWNDWTFVTHDYALVLFEWDGSTWVEIDREDAPQTGVLGQRPQEFLQVAANSQQSGTCGGLSQGAYGWGVFRNSASSPRNLQFFTTLPLDQRLEARSLTFPADSPSAFSIAALNVSNSSHEYYSSEGPILAPGGDEPTGDEYPKPDTASFARVSTVSAGSFAGTSASAPHVAGMAALLKQRHPGMTRNELVSRLQQISVIGSNDLGTIGHDFQHGYGRLRFQLESALAIAQQPTDTQVGDPIGPVKLELRDDEGLVVLSGPTSELNAAIGNDPSGGEAVLSGTVARPVVDGLTSFDDLSIDKSGTGYTLNLDSAGPGPVATDTFSLSAGPPARLSFDVQPSETKLNQSVTPAISVQVLDSNGNLVTADSSTEVQLAIVAGPGGATLSGGGPVTVASGEAQFASVSIDTVGEGYQLQATDTGSALEPDTSVSFRIIPGEPVSFSFVVQPSDGTTGNPIEPAVAVEVLDSEGNRVTWDSTSDIALQLSGGSGGSLGGGGPLTVADGVALFNSLAVDQAGNDYQLQAVDPDGLLPSTNSSLFDIIDDDIFADRFEEPAP